MSGKWRIIYEESSVGGDIAAQVVTLGTQSGPVTYRIENVETGEIREVVAWDRENLGRRIGEGEFDDE